MKSKLKLKIFLEECRNKLSFIFLITLITSAFFGITNQVYAFSDNEGEHLFLENCSGCHVNGGNIIRRNKTLKLKDLKRNGLDNPAKIAEIARDGLGIMSGYKESLGDNGDEIVANWVWEQSQKAWVQG